MVNHLSRANVNQAIKPIQDVRKMMGDLRESWIEISKQEPPRPQAAVQPLSSNIHIAG
jgi:flagellin-specific chaperone FliS